MAGCFLWGIANAAVLFYAINQLPVSEKSKRVILLIAAVEMMTSMHSVQFNPMLTGFIILSFTFVHNKKEIWATLFIAIAILTKIYGVAGLAFILFSDNKIKFLISFTFWMLLLIFLPVIISSPHFILESYRSWYIAIAEKNDLNNESVMQGMTAMRIIKKLLGFSNIKDAYIILTGALFYLFPLARFKQFGNNLFRLCYLSFLLIGVVIFSSSAEAPTFIIAMAGVAIWFASVASPKPWMYFLMVFALLLTTFSSTDLFPNFIKATYIRPYGLKALPCLFIWMVIAWQLLSHKFNAAQEVYE
jgi:Glycosyltransferase family 87